MCAVCHVPLMILSVRFSEAFGSLTWLASLKLEAVTLSFLSECHSGAALWHIVASSMRCDCDKGTDSQLRCSCSGLLAHMDNLLALTCNPMVALLGMGVHRSLNTSMGCILMGDNTISCRWWMLITC